MVAEVITLLDHLFIWSNKMKTDSSNSRKRLISCLVLNLSRFVEIYFIVALYVFMNISYNTVRKKTQRNYRKHNSLPSEVKVSHAQHMPVQQNMLILKNIEIQCVSGVSLKEGETFHLHFDVHRYVKFYAT